MNWNEIWNTIVNFFKSNGWTILTFFLVLVFGIIIIKILINIIRKIFSKTKMEKITQQFLMGAIKLALYLVWVLALLSIIGVQITGIITTLSALILAIGLALESNIANLANGIVIVSTHMFKKGDFITVGDVSGNIIDINFLFTTLQTLDNKRITLPNSTIVNSSVINAGANPVRRVDFTFSVAYETDVELVKKIIIDVMKSNGKIYVEEGKMPFCRLKTLGSSSIDFFANCWCDTEDYWDTYYDVMENVYNEFKRNGISVPFTQIEMRNRTDKVVMPYNKEKLPQRVEKQRNITHKFDLETMDFTHIFHTKKFVKEKQKEELKEAKENIKRENKQVKAKIKQENKQVRAKIKQDSKESRAKIKQDSKQIRAKIKQDNKQIRAKIKSDSNNSKEGKKEVIKNAKAERKEINKNIKAEKKEVGKSIKAEIKEIDKNIKAERKEIKNINAQKQEKNKKLAGQKKSQKATKNDNNTKK